MQAGDAMTSPLKGIYIGNVAYIAVPVAYMDELLAAHQAKVTLPAIEDELAQMAADLTKFRAGVLPSFVVMGREALEEVEEEWIGSEHSTKPFNY